MNDRADPNVDDGGGYQPEHDYDDGLKNKWENNIIICWNKLTNIILPIPINIAIATFCKIKFNIFLIV